jgi:protein involved in polysaccharide export with SLBB domain/tetratricopeptide (TPR) repeat protein
MKKALLIGIFSSLALAPFHCALAQAGDNSPAVKAVDKSSEAVGVTTEERKIEDQSSQAGAEHTSARNQTTSTPAQSTEAISTVLPEASLEAQKNYNAGVALYNSGQLDKAIIAFKEANRLKPNDPQILYMMGMVYWQSKAFNDAVDSFKRAVRIKPDWAEAYFRLGLTYYVLGRKIPSNEAYLKLLELKSPLANKLYRINNSANRTNVTEDPKAEPGTLTAASTTKQVEAVPVSNSAAANQTSVNENLKAEPAPSTPKEVEAVQVSAPAGAASLNEKAPAIGNESNNSSTTPASSNEAIPAVVPPEERPSPAVSESNNTSTTTATSPGPQTATATAPVTRIATGDPGLTKKTIATDGSTLTEIYKVGVGDVLDVRLLNSAANRSTLYSVIEGGLIDFPIAGGPISVGGLTIKDIQARITSELKRLGVEERTQVAVGVRLYASHTVIITGLVGSPGTKILRREAVPLYVLLAEVQPRLDAARAAIMRAGAPTQVVDLSDSAALSFLVRPGDVINLTARPQDFYYIAGRINYPGQKVFQSGITLIQAILAAGGLARDNIVELSREGSDGRLTTTTFNLKEIKSGKIEDPKLQPGDRIEVFH